MDRQIQVKGIYELESLAYSFNKMAEQLRLSFTTLEKANTELEERVEERTAEMKAAKEVADTANQAKSEFLANMSQGGKRRILVVDDKWENRSVIVNLLQPVGFEMMEAVNGKEGLDSIIANQPDLIITDLLMPIMDGYTLMEKLSESVEYKDIPVVASSASVFETDRYKSLNAGAIAFLPKPIPADSLFELLRVHLQLEWIYEEVSQESPNNSKNPKEIILPEKEVLINLCDLAKEGDTDGIISVVDELKLQNSEFIPFAATVVELAENFQLKKLREMLNQAISDS
jgi:CheY-like chemotaxis protein